MSPEIFALVAASAVCHAVWNFAARRAAGDFVALWLAQCVAALALCIPAGFILWADPSSWPPSAPALGYVAATGLTHAVYFRLLARAYERGEISVVYPIARGSGVGLTAVLAWLILDERIDAVGAGGIGLVLTGILVLGCAPMLRAGAPRHGYATALGVGVSIAAYSLVDKIGANLVQPVVYIWLMFAGSALLLSVYVAGQGAGALLRVAAQRWRFLLVVGPGAAVSYLLILFAYTMGPVSYIVAAREVSVIIGALLGVVFLKEQLSRPKLIAIVAIAAGLVLIRAAG